MVVTVEQGTIIIIDVGRNVAESNEKNSKTFFEEAKECASNILEKKIVSYDKHLISLILLGTVKTKNNMSECYNGAFRHIEMSAELQEPTWQMIENLPETPTNKTGDWFDALIVAADHFKNGITGYKIIKRKIILITNFQCPSYINTEDMNQAIEGFKLEGFEVDVIGPNLYGEFPNKDIENAKKIIESTNGVNATFEDAMSYLQFHKKKSSYNSKPWNVDLSVGPNIKIPVSAFIHVEDKTVVKWFKAIKDSVTSKPSTTESIYTDKLHIKQDDQTPVDHSNVIKGYHYGQRVIPFTECDKQLLYDSGERCLSVYGFTKAESITWQNLNGIGAHYVFARKDNPKAQAAIKCLVKSLHELDCVAIVRKVYSKGSIPKMYVLMPVIDTMCLSLINICYKEDYKVMPFPQTKLNKYSCSKDQVNTFKKLIEAMDLTKAYDETYDEMEAFPVGETVDPFTQYILDCLVYRAKNPNKPLPPPRDEILALFKVPAEVQKRSKEPLEKLSQLFNLVKVENKYKRKQKNDDVFKHPSVMTNYKDNLGPKLLLPPIKKEEIEHIGTLQPVEDFEYLIEAGKSVTELASEMTDIIEKIFFFSFDDTHSKALKTMKFFREQCVADQPSAYNDWLQKFVQVLTESKKVDLISCIRDNNLSFILKEENNKSTYSGDTQEDSQVYENDTVPIESSQMTIDSEVNNLFDAL